MLGAVTQLIYCLISGLVRCSRWICSILLELDVGVSGGFCYKYRQRGYVTLSLKPTPFLFCQI